jgi:hypothetical protein
MGWFIIFIILYVLTSLGVGYSLYSTQKKYYQPKMTTVKGKNGEEKVISIHEKYDVFARKDQLSFIRIMLGSFFIIPKGIMCVLTVMWLGFSVK